MSSTPNRTFNVKCLEQALCIGYGAIQEQYYLPWPLIWSKFYIGDTYSSGCICGRVRVRFRFRVRVRVSLPYHGHPEDDSPFLRSAQWVSTKWIFANMIGYPLSHTLTYRYIHMPRRMWRSLSVRYLDDSHQRQIRIVIWMIHTGRHASEIWMICLVTWTIRIVKTNTKVHF